MTPEEMMRRRLPRSVRNNNPGNLEASSWVQKQPGYIGSDGRFAIFETPDAGYAAMEGLLQSYSKRGLNTVGSIINRWSPQSDPTNQPGSTNNYARSVAKAVGVSPTDEININDPELRGRLVRAMAEFEGGGKIPQMGAAAGATSPMSYNPTQVASAGNQSWSQTGQDALRLFSGGLLGNQVPSNMNINSAKYAASAEPGFSGEAGKQIQAAATDYGFKDYAPSGGPTAAQFAGLGNVGMMLMAAGAPRQTWTPGPAPKAVRGQWRDDIFAGLLG